MPGAGSAPAPDTPLTAHLMRKFASMGEKCFIDDQPATPLYHFNPRFWLMKANYFFIFHLARPSQYRNFRGE